MLSKPDAQMGDGSRGQRCDPLLSPLAVATYMRARAEMDIATAQADQFGGAKPRLYRKGEQRPVAPPGSGHSIRGGEKGPQFWFDQPGHQPPIKTLRRDHQNTFDGGGMFRIAQGGVSEQGTDRSQPGIAGPYPVFPVALQMVEEGTHQGRIEIVYTELSRLLAVSLRRPDKQQPQGIALGFDRVRADLTLADVAVC